MCRNIRQLHNFEPPATADEVHDAAVQFVRKISGSTKPSAANAAAFEQAVEEIGGDPPPLGVPCDQRTAQGPRSRGRQGPCTRPGALRGLGTRGGYCERSRWLRQGCPPREGHPVPKVTRASTFPPVDRKLDARVGGWRVAALRRRGCRVFPRGAGKPVNSGRSRSRFVRRADTENARQRRAHRRQPVLTAPSAGRGQAGQARPRARSRPHAPGALDATAAVRSQLPGQILGQARRVAARQRAHVGGDAGQASVADRLVGRDPPADLPVRAPYCARDA